MLKTGHLNSGRVHFCLESVIVLMLPAKLDVGSHVSVFNYLPKSAQNEIRDLEALCQISMRICNLLVRTHAKPNSADPFLFAQRKRPRPRDVYSAPPKRPIRRYLVRRVPISFSTEWRTRSARAPMKVLEPRVCNRGAIELPRTQVTVVNW